MADEKIVFLGGHRKCGTTMFLNLFDGHEECCVFPTDISVLYAYFPVFTEGDYSADERIDRLDRVVFGSLNRLREKHDLEKQLPVDSMREHFFETLDRTQLERIDVIIRQIVESFREAVALSAAKAPLVVLKETSLEIYATFLSELFPGAQFIQLLRDPRDNLGALRAGVAKHYSLFDENEAHILASLLHRVGLSFQLAEPNIKTLGTSHFKCVAFEDLAQNPSDTMRDVAEFAGIPFADELTRPTVMGRPTAGNNYDEEKFFDVTARNIGRWRERVSELEAQVIEFHLGDLMEKFGYERAYSPDDSARAAAKFYRWTNYRYFFKDSFAVM